MIFVAGSTGFAPIKSVIEHALSEGETRPIHLYCGVRAVCDLYMDELARSWAETHANISYIPVLSEPMKDDDWQGRTGFVHEAIVADFPDLSDFDVYAGGPPIMVSSAHDAFLERGLPEDRFNSDPFEFSSDAKAAQETATNP